MKYKQKKNYGITLIALVITILILVILAGVTIATLKGTNLFNNAIKAKEKSDYEAAKEAMELKLSAINTDYEMHGNGEAKLQFTADKLCEDDDIEYMHTEGKKQASIAKITLGKNATKIYTKLRKYKYEFEINDNIQIASIDGKPVENVDTTISEEIKNAITKKYQYSGNYQEYIVPATGVYKIECWGAQGNYSKSLRAYGGLGGYTSGTIQLKYGEKLYIYVGENRTDRTASFNCGSTGGSGSDSNNGGSINGYGGGGATDVRLIADTNWNDFDSLKSRIMVAGGGGGATDYAAPVQGGYAGGLVGGSGYNGRYNSGVERIPPTGATQTSGGENSKDAYVGAVGQFGIGGNGNSSWGSGGGGGYYGGTGGGYSNCSVDSGSGGSSFISGFEGCNTIDKDSTSGNIIHTGQSNHYSGYVFSNCKMIDGNSEMPKYDETGTMVGNSGNGYAKISIISSSELNANLSKSNSKSNIEVTKEININSITLNLSINQQDDFNVRRYYLYVNNKLYSITAENKIIISDLERSTEYKVKVMAVDENNNYIAYEENIKTLADYASLRNKWQLGIQNSDLETYKGTPQYLGKDEGVYLKQSVLATKENYILNSKYTIIVETKGIPNDKTQARFITAFGYGAAGWGGTSLGFAIDWTGHLEFTTGAGDGKNLYYNISNSNYDTEKWHINAFTFDGTKAALYLDGVKMQEKNTQTNIKQSKLYIGGISNSGSSSAGVYWGYGDGYYRNIAIYNDALTDDQISNYSF